MWSLWISQAENPASCGAKANLRLRCSCWVRRLKWINAETKRDKHNAWSLKCINAQVRVLVWTGDNKHARLLCDYRCITYKATELPMKFAPMVNVWMQECSSAWMTQILHTMFVSISVVDLKHLMQCWCRCRTLGLSSQAPMCLQMQLRVLLRVLW